MWSFNSIPSRCLNEFRGDLYPPALPTACIAPTHCPAMTRYKPWCVTPSYLPFKGSLCLCLSYCGHTS
ncbi:High-affinity glucose transporter RGT2 [Fusarium oxysporum f. sp. albedinis]|nr:High-affinity glucose transporter RGT2 [Fusarium oxysporum f. sp. albedinis]